MVHLIVEGRRDGENERLLAKTLVKKLVSIRDMDELGIRALFKHMFFFCYGGDNVGSHKFHSFNRCGQVIATYLYRTNLSYVTYMGANVSRTVR